MVPPTPTVTRRYRWVRVERLVDGSTTILPYAVQDIWKLDYTLALVSDFQQSEMVPHCICTAMAYHKTWDTSWMWCRDHTPQFGGMTTGNVLMVLFVAGCIVSCFSYTIWRYYILLKVCFSFTTSVFPDLEIAMLLQ